MPKQKIGATRDRQRSLLAAWPIDKSAVTVLGHDFYEQVVPLKQHHLAYAVSWAAGALDRSWGRFGASTISLVNVTTGERTKVVDRADDRFVRASPEGKYILYYVDGQYWTIDTARRTVTNITKAVATVVRRSRVRFDRRAAAVVRRRRLDEGRSRRPALRQVRRLGGARRTARRPTRLTDGAAEQIRVPRGRPRSRPRRHRSLEADLSRHVRRLDQEVRLRASRAGRAPLPRSCVWLDKSVTRLAKAKDADVYEYVVQSYDDSPDAFVGGARSQEREAGHRRPMRSRRKYAWGHAELVEFKSEKGQRLQGVLRYPAGYETGKKYPMIVYVYEKRSDSLHTLHRAVGAGLLQRARRSRAPATSSSSPTSSFVRASRGCRWSSACAPRWRRSSRWA